MSFHSNDRFAHRLSTEQYLHFEKDEALFLSAYTYDSVDDISYHDHSGDLELSVVTHGYGYHYINDQICEVSAGQAVLIDPGSFHSFFPADADNRARLRVMNCVFSRTAFKNLEPHYASLTKALDYLCDVTELHPLRANMNALGQELSEFSRPIMEHMIKLFYQDAAANADSILFSLAMLLLEFYRALPDMDIRRALHATPQIVVDAKGYIDAHYTDVNFAISSLYRSLYVSKSHLCTLFRTYMNSSPIRYLNTLRIQLACDIIQEEIICPKDLYRRVGYDEYNTFYINFRKFTGFSVRDYVKAVKICAPAVRKKSHMASSRVVIAETV